MDNWTAPSSTARHEGDPSVVPPRALRLCENLLRIGGNRFERLPLLHIGRIEVRGHACNCGCTPLLYLKSCVDTESV